MFSTTTSLTFTSSSSMALPRGDFRLSVTPFLQEFSSMKNQESSPRLSDSAMRPGSPAGGSILMTSAPSHASICVLLGPASYCVRSSTRMPSSALGMSGSSAFPFVGGGPRYGPPHPPLLGVTRRPLDARGSDRPRIRNTAGLHRGSQAVQRAYFVTRPLLGHADFLVYILSRLHPFAHTSGGR